MKHLDWAERTIGVRERRGDEHHPDILRWHATTSLGDWLRSQDETAWCSSWMNACFDETYGRGTGTGSALARSWIRWGSKVDLRDWRAGDVMVIKRKRKRGGYHVLFPYGVDRRHIAGLGGNQSDAVQMSVFSRRKWDIVAVRRYCPSA